jgi:hypothetical protein
MHRVQLQFGYNDRLQIYVKEVARVRSFQKKENPIFLKVYARCITYRTRTYAGCINVREHTYTCCRTIGHVFLVSEGIQRMHNRQDAYICRLLYR